jgi:NAD(P)-dependent dehydrogenase (short-subunit alcohol dehydrogenase family)
MANRLEGKVALVTGAGQGIGRASAHLFAREGARVLVAEIDSETGEQTCRAIREDAGDAIFVQTDTTDEASVTNAFAMLDERYGRLDVLFNCVGGSTSDDTDVGGLSLEVFERTMARDVHSTVLCTREGLPRMRSSEGGSIINMSSYLAFRGAARVHSYTSAKGAIGALTRAMAGAYAHDRIRANAIAPGRVLTERARLRQAEANVVGDPSRGPVANATRWDDYPFSTGEPEDIAYIAVFLASDESRMINGQVILADGGITAY